jgi:hypothetical protein
LMTAMLLSGSATTRVPPPPDGATLGDTLARLDTHDADAIMSGLAAGEGAEVERAQQSAAYRFAVSGTPPARW